MSSKSCDLHVWSWMSKIIDSWWSRAALSRWAGDKPGSSGPLAPGSAAVTRATPASIGAEKAVRRNDRRFMKFVPPVIFLLLHEVGPRRFLTQGLENLSNRPVRLPDRGAVVHGRSQVGMGECNPSEGFVAKDFLRPRLPVLAAEKSRPRI